MDFQDDDLVWIDAVTTIQNQKEKLKQDVLTLKAAAKAQKQSGSGLGLLFKAVLFLSLGGLLWYAQHAGYLEVRSQPQQPQAAPVIPSQGVI